MKTLTAFSATRVTLLSMSAAAALAFLGSEFRPRLSPTWPVGPSAWSRTNELPTAPQLLPFTFLDVVGHFEASLGQFPQEKRPNEVVFWGGDNKENFYSIIVTSYGSDLLVKFTVIDDYGMTLVRDLFDARFFQRRESEQLCALLDGRNATRSLSLPRFDVMYQYDSPGYDATISLLFSPRFRSVSERGRDRAGKN